MCMCMVGYSVNKSSNSDNNTSYNVTVNRLNMTIYTAVWLKNSNFSFSTPRYK